MIQLSIPTVDFKYLHCKFYPRYFEDTEINGEEDDPDNPKISGVKYDAEQEEYFIEWVIDIEKGRILNWNTTQTAKVFYKICDDGEYTLSVEPYWGIKLGAYSYVPSILYQVKGDHGGGYGDYMSLKVNNKGYIEDWEVTPSMIENFYNGLDISEK